MANAALPPACSTILGYQIPSSRPSSQQNRFVDLYSQDGKTLVLNSYNDAARLITGGQGAVFLRAQRDHGALTYPVRIALTFPWCIGARAGENLPQSMQEALAIQLNGLSDGRSRLTICDNHVDNTNDHAHRCDFSEACSSAQRQRENMTLVNYRITHNAEAVAPFRNPYLYTVWGKDSERHGRDASGNRVVVQRWGAWQVCTNCRAVRSMRLCRHLDNAIRNEAEEKDVVVREGERSEMDERWGSAALELFMTMMSQDKQRRD